MGVKKRLLTILVAFTMVIALCGCAQKTEPMVQSPTWQEQYDLGMRYLSEGNYAEAIIAFTAAIEIDPKQATIYLGRADAYRLTAERAEDAALSTEYYEKAIADFEEAARLGDDSAEAKVDELCVVLERLKAASKAEPLLEALYQTLEQDDLEHAKELMRQEEYRALGASAGDEPFLYEGNGGVVVAAYGDDYYYYGQWSNNQRSGQGLWIRAVFDDDHDVYTYQGKWTNDLPNGEGTIVDQRDAERVQVEPGYTTSIRTEVTGSFKDGLYDGTIHEVWHMNDGGVHAWSPITAVDGVYQQMSDIPEDIRQRDYYQENIKNGKVLAAMDLNEYHTDLWSSGNVRKVNGLD